MNIASSIRWSLAVLLVAHGAIHILGFLWALDLAHIEEIGGPTLFITEAVPGEPAAVAFGLLWLISMLTLMTAGIGVARTAKWGLPLAGISAGLSLVPTITWWSDAWIGSLINAAILIVVIIAPNRSAPPATAVPDYEVGAKAQAGTATRPIRSP